MKKNIQYGIWTKSGSVFSHKVNAGAMLAAERLFKRQSNLFFLSVKVFRSIFDLLLFFQDILENESINLDWMFRYSLINDIVKVRGGQTENAVNNKTEVKCRTEALCYMMFSYKCWSLFNVKLDALCALETQTRCLGCHGFTWRVCE